jgi:hypothetical protein
MPGARNQFVLMKASKKRGGDWWSPDDYDVRDSHGKVVGRIPPPASTERPAVVLDDNGTPPVSHNRGYSTTREHAMADFKARWAATTV